jgi:endonuclease/exonuclease/phosphatase (EEP) superfamily protein YafD
VVRLNRVERRQEARAVSRWANAGNHPLLVAGDFNLPVESTIYQQSWSGFLNAFSEAGMGLGYTFVTRWSGVRIDHILAGSGWRCRHCWVGPNLGSPHRPVIADLEWVGSLPRRAVRGRVPGPHPDVAGAIAAHHMLHMRKTGGQP